MSKETGGQAFPQPVAISPAGDEHIAYEGMTLRDYYMAHAPITVEDAMLAAREVASSIGMLDVGARENVFRFLALLRGEYADAMIDARVAS